MKCVCGAYCFRSAKRATPDSLPGLGEACKRDGLHFGEISGFVFAAAELCPGQSAPDWHVRQAVIAAAFRRRRYLVPAHLQDVVNRIRYRQRSCVGTHPGTYTQTKHQFVSQRTQSVAPPTNCKAGHTGTIGDILTFTSPLRLLTRQDSRSWQVPQVQPRICRIRAF